MWIVGMLACSARVHVVASLPDAQVGMVRSSSQPQTADPYAEYHGTGELVATVPYSVFDTWWVWARAPGGEATMRRYPTELAGGPFVGCLFTLIACVWVVRPSERVVHIDVDPVREESPQTPSPPLAIPLAAPIGCGKDTDCKGDRVCRDGVCGDP